MKKMFQGLFRFLIIALFNFLLLQKVSAQTPPSEPMYEGKSLSQWLKGFTDDAVINSDEARDQTYKAIHETGTNAVPMLLEMFRSHDVHLCVQAAFGFLAVGREASNAVPALIKIHEQTSFVRARNEIVRALGSFGLEASEAIPLLVRATTDEEKAVRNNAAFALGKIHSRPEISLAALIKCLDDPAIGVRGNAADALAAFGPAAKSAVPKLIALLNDQSHIGPQPPVSAAVTNALRTIDPIAAAKLGIK